VRYWTISRQYCEQCVDYSSSELHVHVYVAQAVSGRRCRDRVLGISQRDETGSSAEWGHFNQHRLGAVRACLSWHAFDAVVRVVQVDHLLSRPGQRCLPRHAGSSVSQVKHSMHGHAVQCCRLYSGASCNYELQYYQNVTITDTTVACCRWLNEILTESF